MCKYETRKLFRLEHVIQVVEILQLNQPRLQALYMESSICSTGSGNFTAKPTSFTGFIHGK